MTTTMPAETAPRLPALDDDPALAPIRRRLAEVNRDLYARLRLPIGADGWPAFTQAVWPEDKAERAAVQGLLDEKERLCADYDAAKPAAEARWRARYTRALGEAKQRRGDAEAKEDQTVAELTRARARVAQLEAEAAAAQATAAACRAEVQALEAAPRA